MVSDATKIIELKSYKTEGQGDCAFHAALGEWDDVALQFVYNNVTEARKKVSDIIRQCTITNSLYKPIREAIQQIIISKHNPAGTVLQQAIAEYKAYLKGDEISIRKAWEQFEQELIIDRIDDYVNRQIEENPLLNEDQSLNTFQRKFIRCLSLNDGELYCIILSIERLNQKFQDYNYEANKAFDLDKYLQKREIINEYAKLVESPGYWLLPCELSILAYALDITIDYYAKDRKTAEKRKIETFNPGNPVSAVCFNGINHYEKMAPIEAYNTYRSSDYVPSITTPKPIAEISKEWDLNVFIHFLKLMVISNNKAHRVDCKFKEVNVKQVKELLIDIRDELLKKSIDRKLGVLILRLIDNKPIVFQISIEEKDNKSRLCLNIFSDIFLENIENNLRCRLWNESIKGLKDKFIPKLNDLIGSDFLQSQDKEMTRLNCYSVSVSIEYSKTVLLHKLFSVLGIEPREIIKENQLDPKAVIAIDQEYLYRAQSFFIKDASVAKAQQGFSYQEHLIMLLAYLAKEHHCDKKFSLISEAMVPEAWNDVLLEWNEQLIFFQQKHRSLYSASVKETYPTAELLHNHGDASIVKYYHAYCALVKSIKSTEHPLYRYQVKLISKNIKFIFFSNRSLPIVENLDEFHLKEEKDIKFEKVNFDQIPLIELKGFAQVVGNRSIWRIKFLDVNKLGLSPDEQNSFNEFIQLFYFFTEQMNSDELLHHCKRIMHAPLGGFGQALLADTFAHYIHNWFVTENPVNHVFDRAVITDFFDNHERYHHNLVKYSCYNHPAKEIEKLVEKHLVSLKMLNCCKKINRVTTILGSHTVISCEDPLLAIVIIQELFPAGERQIFTPFSSELMKYQIADGLKYAIVVGEDDEVFNLICKIKEHNKARIENSINLIQVKAASHNQYDINLNIQPKELEFLQKEYSGLSILIDDDDICLTNLLCFAVTPLTSSLSSDEISKYVPQRLTDEEVVLPYDKIEKEIKEWVKSNKEVDNHWVLEKLKQGGYKYKCKIQVKLPTYLLGKSIQSPSNPKFEWAREALYYIHGEQDFAPIPYNNILQADINFEALELEIKSKINEQKFFDKNYKDFPDTLKIIKLELTKEYVGGELPKGNWVLSDNKKVIFYYPYGSPTSQPYVVEWKDIYSDRRISIIEAEAACGKTWHLRSKISLEQMLINKRIPIFIRIKDMENIKDLQDPIHELLDKSLLSIHIGHMAKKYPKYFHLLLDGYDELSNEFSEKFELILDAIISKDYCITVTVRDYQKNKLQCQTSSIIVQQRLHRFNGGEIKDCLKKSLIQKLAINESDFDLEIKQLCVWLQEQVEVSEWLGIPFHVALISEWYVYNRGAFLNTVRPSISEVYNFIVQHQIERGSNRNRGDVYKVLNKLAWLQIFGEQKKSDSFPMKDYHFKRDLSFDLERTGLVRDPYAKNPELFHRTFAEFLVAKRLAKKLISSSCRNDAFNFELINLLYRTEYRLVCHFFIGLFKIHSTDLDMPYELLQDDQQRFEQLWLIDIIGQSLNDQKKCSKLVVWCKLEEDRSNYTSVDDILDSSKPIDDFSLIVKNFNEENPSAKQLMKDAHREYLKRYFAIYQNISDEENRKCFHRILREMNIRLFLREDYPPNEVSIFDKYKSIDEFDIKSINSAFHHLKQISEKYSWHRNNDSNAFKCWSQGGYKDQDFAMPILKCIGPHLNIIHVFYIRLYVTYGGYSKSDDDNIISAALNHIKNLNNEKNLRVIFSSILLFLSMIDDWTSTQEHPQLSQKIVEQMVKYFEVLLMADEIQTNTERKLFIQILLIDFINYFKLRIYLDCYDIQQADAPILRLIFPSGFTKKLNVSCCFADQLVYQKIYQLYVNSELSMQQFSGIERFQRFFNIWEKAKEILGLKQPLTQTRNKLIMFTEAQQGMLYEKQAVEAEQEDTVILTGRSSSPNGNRKRLRSPTP